MKVWKTVLQVADSQDIDVPQGAEFLTAREQHEAICIWYRCDPDAPRIKVSIIMVGTGHDAPSSECRYVGTGQLFGGSLIFHVFVQAKP